MCHDGKEERKGPYQAKDNGDMKEKDRKKDISIKIGLNQDHVQVDFTQYRLHVVP